MVFLQAFGSDKGTIVIREWTLSHALGNCAGCHWRRSCQQRTGAPWTMWQSSWSFWWAPMAPPLQLCPRWPRCCPRWPGRCCQTSLAACRPACPHVPCGNCTYFLPVRLCRMRERCFWRAAVLSACNHVSKPCERLNNTTARCMFRFVCLERGDPS